MNAVWLWNRVTMLAARTQALKCSNVKVAVSVSSWSNLASHSTWDKIAESQEFKDLMATKKTFIVPAFIFFVLYYFALPVLVGYAPQFMSTKIGRVNLAYLFALSQFFVAWAIAGLYVKAANNFDRLAKDIVEKAEIIKGGK